MEAFGKNRTLGLCELRGGWLTTTGLGLPVGSIYRCANLHYCLTLDVGCSKQKPLAVENFVVAVEKFLTDAFQIAGPVQFSLNVAVLDMCTFTADTL